MPTAKKKAPAKRAKPKKAQPQIEPGSVLIVKLTKGKTEPKAPPGVHVWVMDGDRMVLTAADMHARGWVKRKY